MRVPWKMTVLAGIGAVAIAGCGGGNDGPDASDDPVGALEAAATQWSDSFHSGDSSEAYDLLTAECQEVFTEDGFKALSDFTQTEDEARDLTGVTARVDGEQGSVDLTYENPDDNDSNMPWELVDGEWKTSDCAMRE